LKDRKKRNKPTSGRAPKKKGGDMEREGDGTEGLTRITGGATGGGKTAKDMLTKSFKLKKKWTGRGRGHVKRPWKCKPG